MNEILLGKLWYT